MDVREPTGHHSRPPVPLPVRSYAPCGWGGCDAVRSNVARCVFTFILPSVLFGSFSLVPRSASPFQVQCECVVFGLHATSPFIVALVSFVSSTSSFSSLVHAHILYRPRSSSLDPARSIFIHFIFVPFPVRLLSRDMKTLLTFPFLSVGGGKTYPPVRPGWPSRIVLNRVRKSSQGLPSNFPLTTPPPSPPTHPPKRSPSAGRKVALRPRPMSLRRMVQMAKRWRDWSRD